MSKMNNNSRKNSKNSKNTAKKALRSKISSKKNFKIENLEPRLMMDASAGYDIDKIEEYVNQFDSITVSTEENSLSSLSSFTEFDASSIETSEIANRPMALLRAPAAEPLLNNEDSSADSDSSSLKNSLHLTDSFEISYVGKTLSIGNEAYRMSEIIDVVDQVRLNLLNALQGNIKESDYGYQLNLPAIKAKFDTLNANVSALKGGSIKNFLSAVNICADDENINILGSLDDDISWVDCYYEFFDVEFCLDVAAQRINFGSVSENTDVVASVSFVVEISQESDVFSLTTDFYSVDIGLPGVTAEATENAYLPILVEDDFLKISITEDGVDANVALDYFVYQCYSSFDYDLEWLENLAVPYLDKLDFSMGGLNYNVGEIIDTIDNYALITQNCVHCAIGATDDNIHLKDLSEYLKNLVTKIPLKEIGIKKESDSSYRELLKSSFDESDVISLEKGENTILFEISLANLEFIKDINWGWLTLGSFGADFKAYIKLDLYILDDESLCFGDCCLDGIGVGLSASNIENLKVGALDVDFGGKGKFSFNITIDPSADDISSAFTNKELKLESEGLSVNGFKITDQKETLGYNFSTGKWTLPSKIENIESLFNADIFTISNFIRAAEMVPFLNDLEIPIAGGVKVVDLASKVDSVGKDISLAVANTMQKADAATGYLYSIDVESLKKAFAEIAKDKCENFLESVELKVANSNALISNLLIQNSSSSLIGLKSGKNVFNMTFKPFSKILDKLSVYDIDLPDVTINTEIAVTFSFDIDDSGLMSNFGFGLDLFKIGLKPSGSNPLVTIVDDGFVASFFKNNNDEFKWRFDGIDILREFSFVSVTSALAQISYLKKLNVTIGDKSFGVDKLIKNVGDLWENFGKAFQGAIDVKNALTDGISLDTATLKESFNNLIQDKQDEINSWLSDIRIVAGSIDKFEDVKNDWIDILSADVSDLALLPSKDYSFTVVFTPKAANLGNLSIFGFSLASGLGLNASIALNISVTNESGIVQLKAEPAFVALDATVDNNLPKGLPFAFEGNDKTVRISWDGENGWDLNTPELKWKSNFSLETLLNGLQDANFPFMDKLSFKIGGEPYSIVKIAQNINNYWSAFSGSFYQAVKSTENADKKILLKLSDLATNFSAALEQQQGKIGNFIEKIGIFKAEEYDKIDKTSEMFANIFKAVSGSGVEGTQQVLGNLDNVDDLSEKYIELVEGTNKITVAFTPKQLGLKKLDLELLNLGEVDFDATIALDLTLNVNGKNVTFAGVALHEFDLKVVKDIASEFEIMGQKAIVENGSVIFDVSVSGRKFDLKKCDIEFNFDKLEIMRGSTSLVKLGKDDKFAYQNGKWVYPNKFDKLVSILKNGEFSLSNLLTAVKAFNIPVLNTRTFNIGTKDYTITDIVEQVDYVWNNLSIAVQQCMDNSDNIGNQAQNKISLKLEELSTIFGQYVGDDVKNLFSHIGVLKNITGSGFDNDNLGAQDIWVTSPKTIGLDVGDNKLSFVLDTNSFSNDLKIYSVNIDNITGSFKVQVDVSFHVSDDGKISNFKTSLYELKLDIDLSKNSNIAMLPIEVKNNHVSFDFFEGSEWVPPKMRLKPLGDIFKGIDFTNIPYIKDLNLTIAGQQLNVASVIESIKDFWFSSSQAIQCAIEKSKTEIGEFDADINKLNSMFDELCRNSGSEIAALLGNVKVTADDVGLYRKLTNAYELLANDNITTNSILTGHEFTFVYSIQPAYLNKFELYSIPLGSLGFGMDVAVKVTVSEKAGEIVFTPSLTGVALNIDLSSSVVDGLPITFDSKNIRISYSGASSNPWNVELPDFHMNNENLSIEKLIASAANLPLLKDWKFTVAGETISVADVITKVNTVWNNVCLAVNNAKDNHKLNLASLRNAFSELVGSQTIAFKNYIGDISVLVQRVVDVDAGTLGEVPVSLFGTDPLSETLEFADGDTKTLKFKFTPKLSLANSVKFGPLEVSSAQMNATIDAELSITYENGGFSFDRVAVNDFSIKLSASAAPSKTIDLFGANASITNLTLDGTLNIDFKNANNPLAGSVKLGYDGISINSLSFGSGEFGYDFEKNALTYPSGLDEIFNMDLSLQTILSFAEKMNIPYIGEKIEIAGVGKLSVIDIAKNVDSVRSNLSIALKSLVAESKSVINVNDLYNRFKGQLGNSYSTLVNGFSTSKVNIGEFVLDLKTGAVTKVTETGEELVADFTQDGFIALSSSLKFDFVFALTVAPITILNTPCNPVVNIGFGLVFDCNSRKFSFDTDKQLLFAIVVPNILSSDPTINTISPFVVKPEGSIPQCLWIKVVKDDSNGWRFEHNVIANPSFSVGNLLKDLASIDFATLIKSISNVKIPFINKSLNDVKFKCGEVEYSIPSVVETMGKYWTMVSKAINLPSACLVSADNSEIAQIQLGNVVNFLATSTNMVPESLLKQLDLVVDGAKTYANILNNTSITDIISFDKNTSKNFVFAFTPQTLRFDNLDLGAFKIKKVNIDFKFNLNVKLTWDGQKFDVDYNFDSVGLNINKTIGENAVESISMALFEADVKKGDFKLDLVLDKNLSLDLSKSSALFTYDSIALKAGKANLVSLSKADGEFSYNFSSNEWSIPEKIKSFTSLSGASLVNKIHIIVNTMQTALRSLVEQKTKLDFLDGSIDTIVDIVDKVQTFVYGNDKVAGLLKYVNGSYVPNFDSLDELKNRFNREWIRLFKLKKDSILEKLDKDWVDSDYKITNKDDKEVLPLDLEYDYDTKGDVIAINLNFELVFEIAKEFGLDFSSSLAKASNGLANISTSGYVSASGKAGMIFKLKVDLKKKEVNENTTLAEVVVDEEIDTLNDNEKYTEFSFDDKAISFDESIDINLVDPSDSSKKLDSFTIVKDANLTENSWNVHSGGGSATIEFTESNQLRIIFNQEFDINGSSSADAFAESKLTGSNLQTVLNADCQTHGTGSNQNLVFNVKSKKTNNVKSISIDLGKIEELCLAGIISNDADTKLVEKINEYLSLQKTEDNKLVLSDMTINDLISDSGVAEGNSIMNTYGIYALEAKDDGAGSITVKFGCDPRKVQGYATDEKGKVKSEYYLLCDDAGKVKYMRLSGKITPSGKVATFGLTGAFIYLKKDGNGEQFAKIEDSYEKYEFVKITKKEYGSKEQTAAQSAVDALNNELSKKWHGLVEATCASVKTKDNQEKYVISIVHGNGLADAIKAHQNDLKTYKENEKNIAEEFVENLNATLESEYDKCFYADLEESVVSVNGKSEKQYSVILRETTCIIKNSDSVLEVNIGQNKDNTGVYVNTSDCLDVSSLANAIDSAIICTAKNEAWLKSTAKVSVSIVDGNIVFTSADDVSVTCGDLSKKSVESETDFILFATGQEDKASKVDFQDFGIVFKSTTKLSDVLDGISNVFNSSTVFASNNIEIICTRKDGTILDHLEIRYKKEDPSNAAFEIKNIGTSNILHLLGFSSHQKSVADASGYQYICGGSILGYDWSKLISLGNLNTEVYANAKLEVGTKVSVKEVKQDKYSDKGTLVLSEPDSHVYSVGGFIKIDDGDDNPKNDKFFRITNVKHNAEGSAISIEVESYGGASLADIVNDKTLIYVASANATFGFLGIDAIANGYLDLNASFKLATPQSDEKPNFMGFIMTPDIKPTGSFTLSAKSDVFGTNTELLSGDITLVDDNGAVKVKSSFDFAEDKWKEIINQFKNFSIEQLYTVLEKIIDKLNDITKNTQKVKIPVINKSVGDLVNVANDLRDIIKELRAQKVTSIQSLANLLNTYMEKSHFRTHYGEKIFDLQYDVNTSSVNVVFNVEKLFKTSHNFNFGTTGAGVSGEAAIEVQGSFWFTLNATMSVDDKGVDKGVELTVNKSIDFGADIALIGDNLSFKLGIDKKDDSLLGNLISVGDETKKAYMYGKACLLGSIVNKEKAGDPIKLFKGTGVLVDFSLPIAVFGRLPINVCGMSLGDVLIGLDDNGKVSFSEYNGFAECEKAVNAVMRNYVNDWNEQRAATATTTTPILDKSIFVATSDVDLAFDFWLNDDAKSGESDAGDNTAATTGNAAASKKFVVDFSSVYDEITKLADFANLDWFTQIRLAVAGLNNLFDYLESHINSNMAKSLKSVPVVGSALSSGVDFLSVLKNKVLDPFSKFVYETSGLSAEMLAKKMNGLLNGYFNDSALDLNASDVFEWLGGQAWQSVDGKNNGTWYRSTRDSAEWFFQLGKTYECGADIGFDLGLPGLGIEGEAGLSLSLNWTLDFGFGISKTEGFYFIFRDGDEITVTAIADFKPNSKILGSFAGLGLLLEPGKTSIEVGFGLDLANAEKQNKYIGHQTISMSEDDLELKERGKDRHEIEKLKGKAGADTLIANYKEKHTTKNIGKIAVTEAFSELAFSYYADLTIKAGMSVGIARDLEGKVDGDAPRFPNIKGKFEFEASADHEHNLGIKKLGFTDLEFDMGSFIGSVLGPIISKIQTVIKPLEPLIDFLMTPFPVLDDLGVEITPLDLAKQFSKGKFDDSMVKAIKDLITISNSISAVGNNLTIGLGDFILVKEKGDYTQSLSFLEGRAPRSSLYADLGNYVEKFDKANFSTQASSTVSSAGFNVGDGSWYFFWQKPEKIFQYLLGEDIDLVKYTMPRLSFDFSWDKFIRIWGPLGARLGVSFGASIQLGFGYDTLGIRQFISSGYKDYSRFINGFYVADKDENDNDVNELSFHGGLSASAEINVGVSAGVGGGVDINVGFNLYDPNHDGKVRLGEMGQIIKNDGLFGMFDVNGAITAKLYAYVDLLFYTKKWNITGDKTLFSFNYEHSTSPVLASENDDGSVVANAGQNAGERISTDKTNPTLNDGDETLKYKITGKTITWDGGSATVEDENGKNGKFIIPSENGNDTIIVTGEAECNIEIMAGDGDDIIDLSGLIIKEGYAVIIWGGAGNDTIKAAQGLNIIFGDTGVVRIDEEKDQNDQLVRKFVAEANVDAGVAGKDIIIGSTGRDIIFGGAGVDQIDAGAGDDIVFGDGGKIDFNVTEVEKNNLITDNQVDEDAEKTTEEEKKPTVNELKFVAASSFDGNIVKATRTDISVDGGDDVIIGGAGDDVIYGGAGDDRIDGGAGNDTIYGERGNDRLLGGSGNDTIYGGVGHDIIFGDGIQSEQNVPGKTEKVIVDFVDVKTLFAEKFYSDEFKAAQFKNGYVINKSEFNVVGSTQSADDGVAGADKIYGGEGDDLIFGDNGTEIANVANGNDFIEGGLGNDILDGNGGNDTISGGIGNDIIYGGSGDDRIDGGAGNDSLYGDQGIRQYVNKDKFREFSNQQITFGENLGLSGTLYKDAVSEEITGIKDGNDKIITGPGMDFVDGQGGNDQVTVSFMGGGDTSYANITDSGKDTEKNVLTIEGTEYDDTMLMRMNTEEIVGENEKNEHTLGFVALTPQNPETTETFANTNIERVNFTKGINVVNINANGGDDKIYIDGTAKMTNVDGGAGDDQIQIGQLYNSKRKARTQGIAPDDGFETIQTADEEYLSDGVTESTTLNVEGGVGMDTIISLHNKGKLNMAGGLGDDTFAIHNFETREEIKKQTTDAATGETKIETTYKNKPITGGALSVDGGRGFDRLSISGTNGDDTAVISKEGTLSNSVGVKAVGVEKSTFCAAGGDDMFYVISNNKDEQTVVEGGHGNDTVSIGGSLDEEATLRSADIYGQKNTLSFELLAGDKLEGDRKNNFDPNASAKTRTITESYTVLDTSEAPAVFIATKKNGAYVVDNSVIQVTEGGNVNEPQFYVAYSGDLKGGEIKVTLTAPMLSTSALQSGDREILISLDGTSYESFKEIVITEASQPVAIYVKALDDFLSEEDTVKTIMMDCVWTHDSKDESLEKSANSVMVNVKDSKAVTADDEFGKLLTRSEEFIISGLPIELGEIPVALNNESMKVYIQGVDGFLTAASDYELDSTTVDGKTVYTLTLIGDEYTKDEYKGRTLVVNYRSNTMAISDSRIRLAYDNVDPSTNFKVKYIFEAESVDPSNPQLVEKIILSKTALEEALKNKSDTTGIDTSVYYALNGNVLAFYNSTNKQLVNLYGTINITASKWLKDDADGQNTNGTATDPVEKKSFLTISESSRYLVEKSFVDDEANPGQKVLEKDNSYNSTSFTVKFNEAVAENRFVYVKVDVAAIVAKMSEVDDESKKVKNLSLTVFDGSKYLNPEADGSYILAFKGVKGGTPIESYVITLVADHDDSVEDYGIVTIPAGEGESGKTIEDIEGSVYAYGEGAGMDADFGNPEVLHYKHKYADDRGNVVQASKDDEKNSFDISKLPVVSRISDEGLTITITKSDLTPDDLVKKGNTVKIIQNEASSKWYRIEDVTEKDGKLDILLNESIYGYEEEGCRLMFSGQKDYLFTDEDDNTDRIFVNNQDSDAAARSIFESYSAENEDGEEEEIIDSLKFTNKDQTVVEAAEQWQGEIVANHIEYGEYNLGSGKDQVEISKTLYRKDGFQTFTVVNTGDGEDEITVHSYEDNYDGQLVINAEEGGDDTEDSGDKINAVSGNITKDGMIIFGGEGRDTINVSQGVIAFGDKGHIEYSKPIDAKDSTKREVVTSLGYAEVERNGVKTYETIHTKISKDKKTGYIEKQTDGIARGATSIKSVDTNDGKHDVISAGGADSVVVGGADSDLITVNGERNVVLGDNGEVNYSSNESVGADWRDNNLLNASLKIVQTIDDSVGDVDSIDISGGENVAMGGADGDKIEIGGADNVVVGDAGVYTVRDNCLTVETKSELDGGQDFIRTGDGQNTILGGTDADTILTGRGNDVIVGDGGLVVMDDEHNPLIVTNSGKNVDEERAAEEYEREQANKNEEVVQTDGDSTGTPDDSDDGSVDQTDTVKPPVRSAGGDFIYAGDGDNVIFGGLGKDHIESGKGEDVVFGDNGYATFRGNADLANNLQNTFTDLEGVFEFTNAPEVRTDSTLSFNFQGAAQQGINPDEKAGVSEFEALQWNNITGNLAGTYGNDDKEMVRFNDGTRASSVSVTYAGREAHRTTSTDNSINLQNYNHWLWGNSANNRLMTSGIMTTAPNNMMQNVMEVTIDGLKQYYDSYQVIVYLDLPDANSWAEQSIREVTLTVGDFKQSIFVNDYQGANFNGGFKKSTYQSAEEIIDIINANKTKPANERVNTYGNYVVFEVSADVAHDIDRAIITIQDGYTKDQMNGKDIPGIAGLQIKGVHHKQDIAASTDVAFGGNDSILTRGGDDIVVGGTGGDNIVTHGGDNVIDEDGKIVPRVTETATASSATAQDESGDGAAQVQESDEAKRKREIAEHVAAHTTFGDERLGIYDNDVVFGDNAKMLFTERDGNPETASTLTTAESVTIAKGEISHSEKDSDGNELKDEFKYKDTIITGDGNDVVVGGIGADHIESGATAAANEMMDGINVLSINFTREHSNASDSIAAGEAAGVVVDNAWHNFYRNDRGVIVSDTAYSQSQSNMNAYNEAMNRLCNSPDSSNPYARAEGVEVHMYGKMNGQRQGPSSFTIENHDEIDGDTSNTKLYNTYIASQQSEEIVLKLLNLDTFVGNSGNTIDTTSYDLYVYIGGDNNDTDTFNYLYEIKLTDAQGNTYRRYLNDWTGHKFDGDYKEAYCTNKQKALEALTDFTTPRVEIIGNYVVFHGVTGNMADIRIRNVFSLNGQSPKNLPMITAVQIVSGDGRYKESENGSLEFNDKHYELADIAVGGDHDKDLVYGDEAKLWFDLDVPFASDENIADYKNRVIEAKSIAVDDDVVKAVSTEDYIETGKDRDVVVAGEGADDIRTGAGDDVVLGGSANLIVEHNNPVGVFTPNTEIVLDQHTINTNLHQNYLDNDNANVGQFQNLLNQNRIAGIDTSVPNTNDRLDQIDAGEGRNITSQALYSTEKLVVEPPPPAPPAPDPINQGSGEGQGSGVTTGDVVLTSSPQIVSLTAGETIKLVCTDYPKGNQWWTPNVVIYGNNAGNGVIPEIDWAWDGETRVHTNVTNNVRVDIPDHPNGANGTYEIYLTAKTSGMIFLYVDQG